MATTSSVETLRSKEKREAAQKERAQTPIQQTMKGAPHAGVVHQRLPRDDALGAPLLGRGRAGEEEARQGAALS